MLSPPSARRKVNALRHVFSVSVALLGVLAVSAWRSESVAAQSPPEVQVAQGRLVGLRVGSVETFLGVPYAAAPVGPNRWRAPQPAPHWRGVRTAEHFAPSCYQPLTAKGFGPWTREYVVQGRTSEDCLYLNVWAPVHAKRPLPVMMWIPGGGFISGSGSVPVYDGARLAARGIIVVTINYRLGVLGFFTDPALVAQARRNHEPPGNWGLQDMIAALRWLHTNIAAFGGDPSQITLAGQSAGSIAVQDLLTSPLAAGLFSRAIAESGLPGSIPVISLAQAETAGEALARAQDARTLEELRALSPEKLDAAAKMGSPAAMPIVDGVLLPGPPRQRFAAGYFAKVPILVGMDANDSVVFSGALPSSVTRSAWRAFLHSRFGVMAPRFAKLFPAHSDVARARAERAVRRDLGLAALYAWSRLWLMHSRVPAYVYIWTHVEPGPQSARWGAFHSSEIPYIFRTLNKSPQRRFTSLDRSISIRMSRYWTNFVKTGNPNGAELPVWRPLSVNSRQLMQLGARVTPRWFLPPATLRAMQKFVAQGGHVGLFN